MNTADNFKHARCGAMKAKNTSFNLCASVSLWLILFSGGAGAYADEVPPRALSGQTLDVPAAQLESGEVYHITPMVCTQLVWTSETPLLRVVATCNRVVGYVVAPFDIEEGDSPLLAGAWRVPVASFRTGLPERDAEFHGEQALNVAEHPEITFLITDVRDTEQASEEGERLAYSLTVDCEVTVKETTATVSMPMTWTLQPFTWGTMQLNLGDFVVLRGSFEVPVETLGLPAPDERSRDASAAMIRFDLAFLCSTVRPDKNIDPRVKHEDYYKLLKFLTLVRDFNDPEAGYRFGREYAQEIWNDGPALNRLAWSVLDEADIERRDMAFVEKVVKRANELLKGEHADTLHTLARWHYERGELENAVKFARKACEHLEGLAPYEAAPIRQALESYQAELKAREDGAKQESDE